MPLKALDIHDTRPGPLTEDDQKQAALHRPDAGRHLTDDQYNAWLGK